MKDSFGKHCCIYTPSVRHAPLHEYQTKLTFTNSGIDLETTTTKKSFFSPFRYLFSIMGVRRGRGGGRRYLPPPKILKIVKYDLEY